MTHTVELRDDEVIVTDTACQPSVRTMSVAEAWAGSGYMLFVRDPDRLVEVLRALALRFDDARARVWRDLRPVPPRRFAWRHGDKDAWLEVDGPIARRPVSFDEVPWQTVDDLYVHGPTQPGIPADVRAALIDHLGLDPRDAFPRIDHAAIPKHDWTWDKQDDGETGMTIGGAGLVVGYRYGHDMGWTEHAVERVLTRAANIHLWAPAEIDAEMRTLLASAVAS